MPHLRFHAGHAQLLRAAHPELALRVSRQALGARRQPAAHQSADREPSRRIVHRRGSEAEETPPWPASAGSGRRGGSGQHGQPAVRTRGRHQRRAAASGRLAQAARGAVARHRGNGAAAEALAAPRVQRHSPVLLPVGSGGGRHLADRGGAQSGPRSRRLPRTSARRQRTGESGLEPPRAETGHRRWQDHRDGHAHRLADGERRAPPHQPAFQPRLPRRRPRPHHPRPSARAQSQRSGRLLRQPRTGAAGHAAGPGPRQDRHHQLPRLHAPRTNAAQPRHPPPAARPRRAALHHGNRRPDVAARVPGVDGHEERAGLQRRRPPLLRLQAGQKRGRPRSRATNARRRRRTRRRRECGCAACKRCNRNSASAA